MWLHDHKLHDILLTNLTLLQADIDSLASSKALASCHRLQSHIGQMAAWICCLLSQGDSACFQQPFRPAISMLHSGPFIGEWNGPDTVPRGCLAVYLPGTSPSTLMHCQPAQLTACWIRLACMTSSSATTPVPTPSGPHGMLQRLNIREVGLVQWALHNGSQQSSKVEGRIVDSAPGKDMAVPAQQC